MTNIGLCLLIIKIEQRHGEINVKEKRLYKFLCQTEGCKGEFEAEQGSQRRYCDKCITDKIASSPGRPKKVIVVKDDTGAKNAKAIEKLSEPKPKLVSFSKEKQVGK